MVTMEEDPGDYKGEHSSTQNGTLHFEADSQLVVYTDSEEEFNEDLHNSDEDSNFDDSIDLLSLPPGFRVRRESNPELPETVTCLTTPVGSKVYVVGTAHFSESSQDDVSKTIEATQPDIVLVELCSSRVNILQLDEKTLLAEASNITVEKMRTAIKQSGLIQGIMHLLLLSMSAHLTKQLGMAPGGEFRRAFKEAQRIPGCKIHLGDRAIQVTLRRALSSLSLWQKVCLAWYMITSKDPISKEEVEKCKQKDLLEEMLREMTGEFPALSEVFVKERDMYLANSLRLAAQPIRDPRDDAEFIAPIVVGVVGIGHVPGIQENWEKEVDIKELLRVPPTTRLGTTMKWTFRAALVGFASWACYKLFRLASYLVTLTYSYLPRIPYK